MKPIYDKSLSFEENGKRLTILSLAIPSFLQSIYAMLLGTMNSAMLSSYSDVAVAATAVSNSLFGVFTTAISAFAFGASILVSLALGRKDRKTAGMITFVSLVATFAVALILGIVSSVFAEPLLTMMNAEGELLSLAVGHFRLKSIFLFIFALSHLFHTLLICNGYALYTFIISIGTGFLNLLGTSIVLYSGVTDAPVLGIAVSITFVTLVSLISCIIVFVLKKCPFTFAFSQKSLRSLLAYGIPGKMSNFSYTFSQTFTTSFITMLGTTVVSAKVYIGTITQYVPTINAAIAAAGAILIGRFRGAGNTKNVHRLYVRNVAVSLFFNTCLSLLAFAFHRPLVSIFTEDEAILSAVGSVFLVDIGVQIFRAINQISETSLNACGKVKTTLVINTAFCWLVSVGLAYVFSAILGWGLIGIWLAFLCDELIRAIFYSLIWIRRIYKANKNETIPKQNGRYYSTPPTHTSASS